jgi:type IV pilus assembly protein PilQ
MSAGKWIAIRTVVVGAALLGCASILSGQTTAPADAGPGDSTSPADPESIRSTTPGVLATYTCKDTDIRLALRLLAPYTRKNFVCTKEVTGTVTLDLKEVTFQEALEAVMKVSGLAAREKDSFYYIMTQQQLAEELKAERKMAVRTFRLAYVTAADAKILIKSAMSADGTVDVTPAALAGIDASKTVTGGNSLATDDMLVVRDYEDRLDEVARIIQEIDTKPDQVIIEAVILSAKLNEDNALGVDFSALSGVDFSKLSTATDPADLQGLTTGSLTNAKSPAYQVHTGTTAGVGAGGLSLGFFSNNISVFVRALETVTDVTVVANPKLLILNKQRGEVLIGSSQGYPATITQTETANTQSISFLDTGTKLLVRPFIAKDGFIRMEIHPEESTGTTSTVGNQVVPSKKTVEATSNVLVRDGHTIVIGGLFRESTTASRTQMPLLGNLPFAGTLFRQTKDSTERDEIIFLITPRIVRQSADEAVSEQLKSDVERFRLGARKGLRWWGRDRLANCHVRQARQDLLEGRRGNALWNADMALSLQPRMEEAIRLKERITEKAFWADESQISSAQNIIQRMLMNELGKPTERMITPGKPRDAVDMDIDVREKFGAGPRFEDPLGTMPGRVHMLPGEEIAPADAQPSCPAPSPAPVADEKVEPKAAAAAGQSPAASDSPASDAGNSQASNAEESPMPVAAESTAPTTESPAAETPAANASAEASATPAGEVNRLAEEPMEKATRDLIEDGAGQ